jgi:hypothetical protein
VESFWRKCRHASAREFLMDRIIGALTSGPQQVLRMPAGGMLVAM